MKRFYVLLLAALVVAAPLVGSIGIAPVAGAATRVDAATGATPNYRTFLESDLKAMQKVNPTTHATGGLEGGNYTCLKAQPPYTYFTQDWYGVGLSYLLDVEVGMKTDTTAVKFIAADGYSVTLTLAEIRNANPNGLLSILGWKEGVENTTGGALTKLDDEDGPFRLIVPQDPNIGPSPAGTPNWQKAIKQIRAIEVQPTPPGLPAIAPGSIPAGQIVVYGNILSRRFFTVDKLKSIKQVNERATKYKYLDPPDPPESYTYDCIGIPLAYLVDEVAGTVQGATDVTLRGTDDVPDDYTRTFTMDAVRATYPGNTSMLLAWDLTEVTGAGLTGGTALGPEPDMGPLRAVRPQKDPADSNTKDWLKNVRVVQIDPIDALDPFVNANLVPNDRVICTGLLDPRNVPSMWYLAEGYTGGGFEEWICIGNPNPWKTHVVVEYMVEGAAAAGGGQTQELDVAPFSRSNIRVNDVVGNDKNVSAQVEGYHGDSITVERAMYWNGRDGGHCAAGVTEPGLNWYLAEGSTAGGFETWVLLQNPGDKDADVEVTYMTTGGPVQGPTFKLPASSRKTIEVAKDVPATWSVSTKVEADEPIIAERAMYWNNRDGGHCAVGVQNPGTEWFMAEGATAGGFETWVLVQNPNNDKANVTVTYMTADGPVAGPKVEVAANSRKTIEVAKTLPNDYQVSTKVEADRPIIAERAMYWGNRDGGHSNTAVDSPKFRSFLAEGATAFGFESWILIQNPGTMDATVYITYLTAEGAGQRKPVVVKAGERETLEVAKDLPNNAMVSTVLNSTAPVSVERAMYWDGRIEGSCSGGYLDW